MNSPDFDTSTSPNTTIDIETPGSSHTHIKDSPQHGRKRKVAGASGRGVASLTAEQLAKKRANDREAQRAIRERTKNTIESLERRIHELTAQQPYQELQAVIRQKDAVQAENDEIRRRLAQVSAILQPLLAATGQSLPDLSQTVQQTASVDVSNDAMYPPLQFISHQSQNPRSVPLPQIVTDTASYPSPFPGSDNDSATDPQQWVNQRMALNQQRESMHRNHELSENGEKLNFSFLIDSASPNGRNNQTPSIPDKRYPPSNRSGYMNFAESSTQNQHWNTLPKHCPPTCPLDSILMTFLQDRQRENAKETSMSSSNQTAYQSPAYPSISNLLNPTNTQSSRSSSSKTSPIISGNVHTRLSSPDPISQLMIDIISKFPNISGLAEQVAITYLLFLYMRWEIYPTPENYDRLPEWFTPRPSQLMTPHPAWMDHIPWPRMRDRVVRDYKSYPFENWFLPFTAALSVNWPYEPVDCLLSVGEGEDPIINPVFERHLRRLENWSIGPMFVAAYPQLADTCRVREGNEIPAEDRLPQDLAGLKAGVGLTHMAGAQTLIDRAIIHGQRSAAGNRADGEG